VSKIPTTKNFSISMVPNEELLDTFYNHTELGSKVKPHGQALDDAINKL
jgi:hypothetical protein